MIAFVFPGQGAQKVGMGKSLADDFPICREVFAEADDALGEALSTLCFEGPEERLLLTENTQPAILAMSVAVQRLVDSHGIKAHFAAGHSLGEYSAHVAAGTLSFADALRTVRRRGRYMQEAVPVGEGAMAAILGLDAIAVGRACDEAAAETGRVVSAANLNAPGQVVIAGETSAVMLAGERAKALGAKRVIPLAVSAPFHCALMKPAEERLAPELRALDASNPRIPVVANVDAEPKHDAASSIEALVRQVSSPVRWEDVVRRLIADGAKTFVELGPGSVLAGLIKKIDRGVTVMSVEDKQGLTAALSRLATADWRLATDDFYMIDLTGRVALVTGASRGIGKAIAAKLASRGAQVVAAARSDNARATAEEISAAGGKADALALDVTEAGAADAAIAATVGKYGRIDVLVNNAGITKDQLMLRMKRDDWDAVLGTNLTAAFALTQAALKPMLKARQGRIICISSVVGQSGNAGQANYAASKAGLIGFAKAVALEVASRGITVNVVSPGLIDTDMTRAITNGAHEDWAARIPLKRLGTPEDIAAAVCFLASDEASYITGQVLAVNGGMYM